MCKGWKYILFFFIILSIWNYALPHLIGGGFGSMMDEITELREDALEEARSHPNQVVGAWRELIGIPLGEISAIGFVIMLTISVPSMLTLWIYNHFNGSYPQTVTEKKDAA